MGHLQHWVVVCAFALASGPAYAAATAGAGSSQAIPQASYRYWSLDEYDMTGWQLVTPLSLTSSVKVSDKLIFDASFRAAHIISDFKAPSVHGRVDAFSDTVLGGTLTYLGLGWIEPFVMLDFNLPTGKATLSGSEKDAIMDPDLVDQIRFGEGFNANGAVGGAIALSNKWVMTAAVGFNSRGEYVPDASFPRDEYDPGDQLTAYLRAQYLDQESLFSIAVKYFDEEMSTFVGEEYFNPGDRIDVVAEGTYQFNERYIVTGYLLYQTSGRNVCGPPLDPTGLCDDAKGNGDVYHGRLGVIRTMGEVNVSLTATALMREENDFDPVNDLFIPRRTGWDIGPGVDWFVSDRATLSAGIRVGELYDDATPPHIPTDLTYTRLLSFVSGTWSF